MFYFPPPPFLFSLFFVCTVHINLVTTFITEPAHYGGKWLSSSATVPVSGLIVSHPLTPSKEAAKCFIFNTNEAFSWTSYKPLPRDSSMELRLHLNHSKSILLQSPIYDHVIHHLYRQSADARSRVQMIHHSNLKHNSLMEVIRQVRRNGVANIVL